MLVAYPWMCPPTRASSGPKSISSSQAAFSIARTLFISKKLLLVGHMHPVMAEPCGLRPVDRFLDPWIAAIWLLQGAFRDSRTSSFSLSETGRVAFCSRMKGNRVPNQSSTSCDMPRFGDTGAYIGTACTPETLGLRTCVKLRQVASSLNT